MIRDKVQNSRWVQLTLDISHVQASTLNIHIDLIDTPKSEDGIIANGQETTHTPNGEQSDVIEPVREENRRETRSPNNP